MPTVSTRNDERVDAAETNGLVELARRRIAEGFYERPEVRRTIATLLLREMARGDRPAGSSRPETA